MPRTKFANQLERYAFIQRKLYSAVVSDILDDLKISDRAMSPNVRPIHPDHVVVGKARTMLFMEIFEVYDDPYKLEIEAVDSLEPGDVVVQTTNGSCRITPWGSLLSNAAVARGARGAIIDGFVRDAKRIIELGFPVFSTGMFPLDSKGRGYLVSYDRPIECGGVYMTSGDLIFGDYDGVVVIPHEAEEQVIAKALEKAEKEELFLKELRAGRHLKDIYAKLQIL